MPSAMGSSGAAAKHQWFLKDAEIGSGAVSSASSTGSRMSSLAATRAGWSVLHGTTPSLRRFCGLPTTVVFSVIVMAVAYLVIRCAQQFALKHPVSRRLAAAPEPGPTASCNGGTEENDGEQQEEKKGVLEEAELKASVEDTFQALEELAVTAGTAITYWQPERWPPASFMLLGFAFQELTAFAGFLDGQLEAKRQTALRRFQALRQLLAIRLPPPITRKSTGRMVLKFKKFLDDVSRSPSWAAFPSDPPTRKLLQDLIVMTNMGIAACKTALIALTHPFGIETKSSDPAIKLLKRIRDVRQRQILANPLLSRYMEDLRQASQWQGVYSDGFLSCCRKDGPKSLRQNIVEFENRVSVLKEDLQQKIHLSAGSRAQPEHHPAAPSDHLTGAHGPKPCNQSTRQPPAAPAQQPPYGPFSSVPSPRQRQSGPVMLHKWLPFLLLLQGRPPSSDAPPAHPAPLSLRPHESSPPNFTPQTCAGFPPRHLQTRTLTLRAPTYPFQVVALPSSLPAAPLPFTTKRHSGINQMPPAGVPPFITPYSLQQTKATRFPSSRQLGGQHLPGAHTPHGDQRISWSLAPGAHRVPAAFYGHPLGTPADPGTFKTDSQALPVQARPSGDVHGERGEVGKPAIMNGVSPDAVPC